MATPESESVMTHDELIDAINRQIIIAPPFALGGYTVFLRSLHKVVELHCNYHGMCMECELTDYPCPTIEAIERELA